MLRRKKPLTRKKPLRAARATRRVPHEQADLAADADRKLWALIEAGGVRGRTFHLHERIGPYVVNAYCPAARLALIIRDGCDPERSGWLSDNGIRVLAFSPEEICRDPQAVIEAITRCFELRIVSSKS